jgi:hypothetical protein
LIAGAAPDYNTVLAARSLDEVYVLSLPSFVWFKADYPANLSREGHTCHLIGNRQMLTFGGADPTNPGNASLTRDPFAQGIGIFDMTAMQWSSKYDAGAAAYKSPDVIAAYSRVK